MRPLTVFVILSLATLTASCAGWPVETSAVCQGTQESRQQAANDVIDYPVHPVPEASVAFALGQVAAGCGELED